MTKKQTQISAFVSEHTKNKLERYSQAHGLKKGFIVEEALMHYLSAMDELPKEAIIPRKVVVSKESAEEIMRMLERKGQPTPAMKKLFQE